MLIKYAVKLIKFIIINNYIKFDLKKLFFRQFCLLLLLIVKRVIKEDEFEKQLKFFSYEGGLNYYEVEKNMRHLRSFGKSFLVRLAGVIKKLLNFVQNKTRICKSNKQEYTIRIS